MPRQPHIFSSGGGAAVPDHLRCKRTDGRSWRCPLRALPSINLCSHHQALLLKNNSSKKKSGVEKKVSEKPVEKKVSAAAEEKQVSASVVEKKQVEKQVSEKRIKKKRRRLVEEDEEEEEKAINKRRRKRGELIEEAIEGMRKNLLVKRRKEKKTKRVVGEIEGLVKLTMATQALPDHLRCKRSDGRGWRCYRRRSLSHSFCPHHHSLYLKNNSLKPAVESMVFVNKRKKSEEMDELVRVALQREMVRRKEREQRKPRRKVEHLTVELPNGVMAIATGNAMVNVLAEGGNVGPAIDMKVGFDGGAVLRRCFRSKNVEPAHIGSKKMLPCGRGLGRKVKRVCHSCEQKVVLMTRHSKCRTFFCSSCIRNRYAGMSEHEVKMSSPLGLCNCRRNECIPHGNEVDKHKGLVTCQPRYSSHVVCKLLPALEINCEQRTGLELEASNQARTVTLINDICRCCSKCSLKLCIYSDEQLIL